MPYLKRINSLPLINHISYKYAQVSDIGPSWSSCSLSYGPFMKFVVRSFSHQLLDRFGSNYTNRLSIKRRCAYPILVMVYLGFMELWPFDDSGQISFKLKCRVNCKISTIIVHQILCSEQS